MKFACAFLCVLGLAALVHPLPLRQQQKCIVPDDAPHPVLLRTRELMVVDVPPDRPEDRNIKNFWFVNKQKYCIQSANNGTSHGDNTTGLHEPYKTCLDTAKSINVILGFIWTFFFLGIFTILGVGCLNWGRRRRARRQTKKNRDNEGIIMCQAGDASRWSPTKTGHGFERNHVHEDCATGVCTPHSCPPHGDGPSENRYESGIRLQERDGLSQLIPKPVSSNVPSCERSSDDERAVGDASTTPRNPPPETNGSPATEAPSDESSASKAKVEFAPTKEISASQLSVPPNHHGTYTPWPPNAGSSWPTNFGPSSSGMTGAIGTSPPNSAPPHTTFDGASDGWTQWLSLKAFGLVSSFP